jgi:16S rRNA (cytosine967-C5)-methyltransferase
LPKNFFDVLILDVPCSGSGTYRRNPDLKLKFNEESLVRLVQLQEEITGEAIQFLKKNGKIVYITCSLLPQVKLE